MDDIVLQNAVYKGSKQIGLHHISTAKATGFGAAADDYMERGIDLNEQLIRNKPATYFFRMKSDAMKGAGIERGDVLVVDRSLSHGSGKIIVASFEGELIVRRLHQSPNCTSLVAENETCASITINSNNSFTVWGVVTYVIHTVS